MDASENIERGMQHAAGYRGAPERTYSAGGWIGSASSTVAVTIHPDECLIVHRDGTWLCSRGLRHGSVRHTAAQVINVPLTGNTQEP